MENNIDLKALWNRQPVPVADGEVIIKKVNKLKSLRIRNLVITNVCLIATSVFVGWVWFYYQPQFVTTKVGIVLTIAAMVMYLFVFNKLIPLYNALDATQLNQSYLNNLLQIRQREQFLQTTIMNLYFIMLSAGLGLYMYEYASRMETVWALTACGFTGCWIAFSWFYIRPKQIRKSKQKIEPVIKQVQEIMQQLKEV